MDPDELAKASEPIRAFALAGFFLAHFNRTEIELKAAIGKVLGLNPQLSIILTVDIPFARALDIALVLLQVGTTNEEAVGITKRLKKFYELNQDLRIPIAHREFGFADGTLAIRTRTRAGKLEHRTVSTAQVMAAYKVMLNARRAADEMVILLREERLGTKVDQIREQLSKFRKDNETFYAH